MNAAQRVSQLAATVLAGRGVRAEEQSGLAEMDSVLRDDGHAESAPPWMTAATMLALLENPL
jgi:hypothetical protein